MYYAVTVILMDRNVETWSLACTLTVCIGPDPVTAHNVVLVVDVRGSAAAERRTVCAAAEPGQAGFLPALELG
jgi:hypothetical protein